MDGGGAFLGEMELVGGGDLRPSLVAACLRGGNSAFRRIAGTLS